ncbi:MAG: hypothetical protein ACR2MG_02905 [Pyrinomonadaceae bacterium]
MMTETVQLNSISSATFSQFYKTVPSVLDWLFDEVQESPNINQAQGVWTRDISLPENRKNFESFYKKLRGFSKLNKGWDSYDAEPPDLLAIAKTREILKKLEELNFVPTDVCPSVEGGASIYFVKGNKYADVECFNSGEILGGVANREDEPTVLEIDLNTIGGFIERIQQFLND